jgi:hypothetical protein
MASDETCAYEGQNGPCNNPVHPRHGDNGRCWMESHQPDGPDKEPDHGADDGNLNGVVDGLSMPTKRRLDLLREHGDPLLGMFRDYYTAYFAKAENRREAASLASAAVIRDEIEAHLFSDGIFYTEQIADPEELAEQGKDPADAWVEKPKTQTLEAYQEARKEVRLGLKYEGVNDNNSASGTSAGHANASTLWEGDEGEV